MSRPLPVNLLMAGTGAVLLVSGIGGEPLGAVLKGNFGDVTGKKQEEEKRAEAAAVNAGTLENASDATGEGEGGGLPSAQSAPSPSTFAPSPGSLGISKHAPSKAEQSRGIVAILLAHGITHPTGAQITAARREYERKTGVRQFDLASSGAQEFEGGLPLV
jgi:hypothetical protein